MDIIIKSMSIEGYAVQVPAGLSELFNRSGAWTLDNVPPLPGYRREVKLVDGRFVTDLVYVGDAS